MMGRQQLFPRPTVHGTAAGTVCQNVQDLSQDRKAWDATLAQTITKAVTREMAKAHARYQAILNERSASTLQTSLKVSSGANGFKVMDLFNWTKDKSIYQRWQLWSEKARLTLDAMEGDSEKTKISYFHHWINGEGMGYTESWKNCKTLISQSANDKLENTEGKYSSECIESYFTLFELLLAPKSNQLLAVELHFAKQGSMTSGEFHSHIVKVAKRCKFPNPEAEERAIRDAIFLGMNSQWARDKAINLMNEEGKELTVEFLMNQLAIEDCNAQHKNIWTENVGYPKELVTATAYNTEGYKLWFKQGRFPIGIDGEATAHLLDNTPIPVKPLIDSGASKPILNKHFYDANPFLHTYPRYKIATRGMIIGNDTVLPCNEAIAIMVKFSGHVFHMICYLLECSKDYGLYICQKEMYELEGGADFRNLSFHFLMRSLNLYVGQTVKIKPGQSKMVPLCIDTHVMERNSKLRERKLLDMNLCKIENEKVIINLKSERKDKLVQTMPALMSKGTIFLSAVNSTDVVWKIEKSQMMGSLDCRSLGYFHISRNSLQRIMLDKADFLTDRETIEYFNILKEDHKNVMKFAQEAVLKKQQEIEAKRNTKLRDRTSKGKEDYNDSNMSEENDPYPWLDEKDPRRNMTDEQCLKEYIDLSDSDITGIEKRNLYKVLYKYKKAFSLRDEIGLCQSMEVELELKDESPFFIRPFPIKESDKDIVDKEMRKGCLLGILKKGMSSYSSSIMLIPRKLSGIPRIVTDFRHLNSRLVTLQPSIPLVRDAIQILGASGCEILSLADLRDAYHTLRLSERSKKFCGITPYYGSDSYLYQRLGMGLSVSPAIWQNFIQKVLQEIPDHRKNHLAIIDDCLVFSEKKTHLKHLTNLFKALIRNGLKISPRKCKLFKKSLVYMGHQVTIIDNIPHITPVKSRVEAIVKLDHPKSPKNCKQFCGMVNYLSMFLKDLQTKLIPIYHLTKKGVPFHWGELQQKAFEIIKKDLTEAPVLAMPNNKGHMVLVSDTSKIACGSALYQEQKGRYRLIAYFSKKLPLSAQKLTFYSLLSVRSLS